MEIKIDYYLKDKVTKKFIDVKHSCILSADIEDYSLEKYREHFSDYDQYDIEVCISEVKI